MFDEAVVNYFACLWQAIHAFLYFGIYVTVVDERPEVVCLNEF